MDELEYLIYIATLDFFKDEYLKEDIVQQVMPPVPLNNNEIGDLICL